MCATGLIFMTILPEILPSAFAGLLVSVFCYAVGAGLLDITINPIVNSCPSTNSNQLLCLLHSFYCWGSVAAVGISTLFFALFSTDNWKIMSLVWAILPIVNAVMFTRVPIAPVVGEDEEKLSIKDMLKTKAFWIFMVLILCAGSSEQAVSQWASTFAEKGLGVSKTVGDLAGPMLFSVLMGVSRVIYGKFGDKIDLDGMMIFSGALCMASYLLIALSSSAVLGLVGVALCGFSVGIMWPGTFSKASAGIKGGGTAMFALLALGGDLFRTHFCRNDGERIRRRSQKRHTLRHIFSDAFNRADNFYKTQKGEKLISKSGRIRMINPCSAALIYFCGLHLQE